MSSDRVTNSRITDGSQLRTVPGFGAKRDAREKLGEAGIVAEAVDLFEDFIQPHTTPRTADMMITPVEGEICEKYGIDEGSSLAEAIRIALCQRSSELAPGKW